MADRLPAQPGGSDPFGSPDPHVRNMFSGSATSNVVQAGAIHGDVIFQAPGAGAGAINHQHLRDALVHLTVPTVEGTGVFVAPGSVLATTAAGYTLTTADNDEDRYALLSGALDQDDELAALYLPASATQTPRQDTRLTDAASAPGKRDTRQEARTSPGCDGPQQVAPISQRYLLRSVESR